MSSNLHIEDTFIQFFDLVMQGKFLLQDQDNSAAVGFYNLIVSGKSFTEKQGKFLLKILEKYQKKSQSVGLDYAEELLSPKWKLPFRVIDESKSVTVEKDETGRLWLVIKLPFSLKDKLESLFGNGLSFRISVWDPNRQVRKIDFYSCNLIQLNEFFLENNFHRDDSFLECLSFVEEVWNDQEKIVPGSILKDGSVELINSSNEVVDWWTEHRSGNVIKDMFLAKSMGYPLQHTKSPENIIEKISSSTVNLFWIKTLETFFDFFNNIEEKTAIVVNKDKESLEWVKQFCESAAAAGINRNKIKVCFRMSKEDDTGFNQWIKDHNHGGSVDTGDIFIFQGKPAKWLFSGEHDVKIIVTNSLYPIPSSTTQDWMNSHPCVLFIGDTKASRIKDKNLVEL